jgi:hypothetical protein
VSHPDTGTFHTENSKRTGGLGRKKNTGISMGEKNGMVTKSGNIKRVRTKEKENTTIRP